MRDRTTAIWTGLALLAGLAAAAGSGTGVPILPLFLCSLALTCALHSHSRAFVMEKAGRLFAAGTVRAVLIILGGVMLIQFLPVEMALFAAGDVLAYVEVLGAVSLIAANTRLRPMKARTAQKLASWRASLAATLKTARRGARTARPPRRPPPSADDGEGRAAGWAYA